MGKVIFDNNRMGYAEASAMRSAYTNPNLFGISSPIIIERNVTIITISTVDSDAAYGLK